MLSFTIVLILVLLWLWLSHFLWRKLVSPVSENGRKRTLRIGLWALLLSPMTGGVGFFALPYYYYLVVNPLPNDDELIAHFQSHRADIETLLKIYYAAPEAQPGERRVLWDAPPEVQALKKRASIKRVNHTHGYWMPDPYSLESDRKLFQFDVKTAEGRFAERQYESLQVDIDDPRYFRVTPRYPNDYWIWKALFYIPAVAKTTDGKLWPPVTAGQTPAAYEQSAERLLPNLSAYPWNWRKGECVYRQLETHWFIRMCRAA